MKKTILILFLLCIIVSADTWKKTDRILLGTYLLGETIDLLQTSEILHSPEFYEVNPMIKNDRDMYISGIVTTGIILWICYKFPKFRRSFLIGTNLFKWGLVRHNFMLGIRF